MLQILFNYAVGIVMALAFWRIYRLGLGLDALYKDYMHLKSELVEVKYKLERRAMESEHEGDEPPDSAASRSVEPFVERSDAGRSGATR